MEINTCPHKKLTNRYSWLFCDDCKTHIAQSSDCCRECNGQGFKQRMTSIYTEQSGKKYRCGQCKGTGVISPVPCVTCNEPSVMQVSRVMGVDGIWRGEPQQKLRSLCQCCYNKEAQ
jgi:DnaJ-class molecular chaperone